MVFLLVLRPMATTTVGWLHVSVDAMLVALWALNRDTFRPKSVTISGANATKNEMLFSPLPKGETTAFYAYMG